MRPHADPHHGSDTDERLRRTLASKRLSAFDAARSGAAATETAARLARAGDGDGRDATRRPLAGTQGCDICRAPTVGTGLCEHCRSRLVLPFVDPDAARTSANAYRARRAARSASERAELEDGKGPRRKGGSSPANDQGSPGATAEGGVAAYTPVDTPSGLVIRRADGAGYVVRRDRIGVLEAIWVTADGSSEGVEIREGVEDFLRSRPDVAVSPGCAAALRSLALGAAAG
jgi:hypothetical protein